MTYREQVHGLKKEYTVGNIRVDGHIIKAIDRACAISIQEGMRMQHEKAIEAINNAVAHHPHPRSSEVEFDEPEVRGQKFGEAAGINWAKHQILKALASLSPGEGGGNKYAAS